ncbi:hypothetical protein HK105_200689 [Polyrhizophydium stewartii]|uniref:C2HC/C3H-type domain-containing protein n=1 Tax=Polyrhizophydium stewartii TaxID=2732419 RepID=A0ABR4NJR4_9FUNG
MRQFLLDHPPGAYSLLATRGRDRRIVQLDDHVARLAESAALLSFEPQSPDHGETAAVAAAMQPARDPATLRPLVVSIVRAVLADYAALGIAGDAKIVVLVTLSESKAYNRRQSLLIAAHCDALAPIDLARTCSVAVFGRPRQIPHAKATAWISDRRYIEQQRPDGCTESILVDERGLLLEGTTTNFAVLKTDHDGTPVLITAPLDRILRGTVLKMMQRACQNLAVRFRFEYPSIDTSMRADSHALLSQKKHILSRLNDRIRSETSVAAMADAATPWYAYVEPDVRDVRSTGGARVAVADPHDATSGTSLDRRRSTLDALRRRQATREQSAAAAGTPATHAAHHGIGGDHGSGGGGGSSSTDAYDAASTPSLGAHPQDSRDQYIRRLRQRISDMKSAQTPHGRAAVASQPDRDARAADSAMVQSVMMMHRANSDSQRSLHDASASGQFGGHAAGMACDAETAEERMSAGPDAMPNGFQRRRSVRFAAETTAAPATSHRDRAIMNARRHLAAKREKYLSPMPDSAGTRVDEVPWIIGPGGSGAALKGTLPVKQSPPNQRLGRSSSVSGNNSAGSDEQLGVRTSSTATLQPNPSGRSSMSDIISEILGVPIATGRVRGMFAKSTASKLGGRRASHDTARRDSISDEDEPAKPRTLYPSNSQLLPESEDVGPMEPCPHCQRTFRADRLERHTIACAKISQGAKRRKTFDPAKMRAKGTEIEQYDRSRRRSERGANHSNQLQASSEQQSKPDWRSKHEQLIQSLREARKVSRFLAQGGKASDLPPPVPVENTGKPCPFCGRKFAVASWERHTGICANLKHGPPRRVSRPA